MSGLKVEFIDNSSSQYDVSAARVKLDCFGKQWGKLYLGDRHAASFVQLKFRECKTVVNCCAGMHMFAKEPEVKYLKIDPTDDEKNNHLEEVCKFLDTELGAGKNVVVHCEEGKGKSAGVMMYYVMKKTNKTLAESYRFVEGLRDVKFPPSLIKVLIAAEKKLRGTATIGLEDRKVVFLDGGAKFTPPPTVSRPAPMKSNPYMPIMILGGIGAFFGIVYGALYMITGKF